MDDGEWPVQAGHSFFGIAAHFGCFQSAIEK